MLEKEIEWLHLRKSELEKDNTNWDEVLLDAFNFVKLAQETFRNGDSEKKKLIFRSIGSNWILLDKKLQANLYDWFFIIQKFRHK